MWSVAVAALVSVPLLPGQPYHPGPLWPGDPTRLFRSAIAGAQISVILHHPLQVALLPVTADGRALPSLWLQFMGVLGQLSLRLPGGALYALVRRDPLGHRRARGAPRARRARAGSLGWGRW